VPRADEFVDRWNCGDLIIGALGDTTDDYTYWDLAAR
jgi:hypothetical protein